ncbi:MAG: integrase arm-type DNA-binding domain-containing protein [Hyphomonas sp.]|nr:integrase arm-type DNA-binding domain-containing protein [Hyphomonas sp.]
MGKLTVKQVKAAKPGRHIDGQGLLLHVRHSGSRAWVLRLQIDGQRRDIGLGSDADLTLAEARDKAAHLRKLARQGKDPIAERDKHKALPLTFAQAVDLAHAELSKGWKEKTGEAFRASLLAHAVPVIGRRRVNVIGAADLIEVLDPVWTEKPHQARKIRRRLVQVLQFAKSRGWRSEPVPEAHEIRQGLAKQDLGTGFAAMPYAQVPSFFAEQLAKDASAARLGLLFAILTAARSQEVRFARWDQIDLAKRLWSRPASIMKSKLAHTVTLSPAAIAVLDLTVDKFGRAGLVFPSAREGRPLSDMSLSKHMRAAGRAETVHGFRSSFRDWAAEEMPSVPPMVAEMAIAHSVGNATEKAYLRSDLRALRFQLVDAWGGFVAPKLGARSDG